MNDNINEEKTESPTEHKIKKFRKQGQTKYSRELNSLLVLSTGLIMLWWYRNVIIFNFMKIMSNSFHFNYYDIINQERILLPLYVILKEILFIFFPFFIVLGCIVIIPSILFSGVRLSIKSLKFNLQKLNLFHGLKKIFSFQIIIEFIKIIIKLLIISSISFCYLLLYFYQFLMLINENNISSLFHGCDIIFTCCFLVILGLVPIVIFDVVWIQLQHYKNLKMTHQEIKEELREREGNSVIKMRVRQLMKASARRRMILDVPKSDVIITNPIHYAVALQYNENTMNAPKVIAKGIGYTAVKIQYLAIKNNISIISAPLLARALYRYSEIGEYIPGPLYKAVAEILAWVWKVRKWKKEGGDFPKKPKNILIPSEFNFTGEQKNNG